MGKKTKAVDSAVAGKKFMFTGKLAAMTRSQAQSYVTAAGAVNAGSVSKDLDYLVIGDDGSFLYGAGTKGEKTLKAEALIAKGHAIAIISETDFLAMVNAPASSEPAKEKIKVGPEKETVAADGSAFAAAGNKFMFTGKLSTLSRAQANARVVELGGINAGSVSKDLDFLVVGDDGSPLFGAGAKGDKILRAEKLQAEGFAIQIIAESAFMKMTPAGKRKKAR